MKIRFVTNILSLLFAAKYDLAGNTMRQANLVIGLFYRKSATMGVANDTPDAKGEIRAFRIVSVRAD